MKHILVYKLLILNLLAFSWIGLTNYQSDWFGKLVHSDTTGICYAILAFAVLVWIGTMNTGFAINKAFNDIRSDYLYLNDWQGNLRIDRLEWIERAAGWMLFLGLIGTLYGLMLSLSGVNVGNFNSVDGIKQIAVQMVAGLRVEISTTIVGAMFALWTEVNYTVIKHTATLLAAMEEEAMMEDFMGKEDLP